jgi:hypothetical protein
MVPTDYIHADIKSMRSIICHLLILLLAAPLGAEDLVRPDDFVKLPLPEGWIVGGDETGFPIQLVNEDLTAELQIFRSDIAADEIITDGHQLRSAVDDIIGEVILTLPESELLTNTGYQEDNRVCFVLEFVSYDSTAETRLRHRLMGGLYRHPEGYQILFTLWAKAADPTAESVAAEFRLMQNGFAYTGPAAVEVMATSSGYRWWLLGGLVVVLLLILTVRKRTRRSVT